MIIRIDRRGCNVWQAACESHFAWHFLRQEVTPVDCVLEMIEDEQPVRLFLIHDRDGTEKVLRVDEGNLGEAYDSWQLAWEKYNPHPS